MIEDSEGDFDKFKKLIIYELNRHNNVLEELIKNNISTEKDLIKLNIYAGICGMIGGIIITIILTKVV